MVTYVKNASYIFLSIRTMTERIVVYTALIFAICSSSFAETLVLDFESESIPIPSAAPPPSSLPTLHHFTDVDIVSARSGWSDSESLVFFKCGPYIGHKAIQEMTYCPSSAHHVHPDVLIVTDDIVLDRESLLELRYHPEQHTSVQTGKYFIFKGEKATLRLDALTHEGVKIPAENLETQLRNGANTLLAFSNKSIKI